VSQGHKNLSVEIILKNGPMPTEVASLIDAGRALASH
jgi:hypothetical protein